MDDFKLEEYKLEEYKLPEIGGALEIGEASERPTKMARIFGRKISADKKKLKREEKYLQLLNAALAHDKKAQSELEDKQYLPYFVEQFNLIDAKASSKDCKAIYQRARMLELGLGTGKDPKLALAQYKIALRLLKTEADNKSVVDTEAQRLMGEIYRYGHGVNPSTAEAYRYYESAAENGSDKAQKDLDSMLTEVAKKMPYTKKYSKLTKKLSGYLAPEKRGEICLALANIHKHAAGPNHQSIEVCRLYHTAADICKNSNAEYFLSGIYKVIGNKDLSEKYLQLAAEHGHVQAVLKLEHRDAVASGERGDFKFIPFEEV